MKKKKKTKLVLLKSIRGVFNARRAQTGGRKTNITNGDFFSPNVYVCRKPGLFFFFLTPAQYRLKSKRRAGLTTRVWMPFRRSRVVRPHAASEPFIVRIHDRWDVHKTLWPAWRQIVHGQWTHAYARAFRIFARFGLFNVHCVHARWKKFRFTKTPL